MSNKGKGDFQEGLKESIIDPTRYLDNLSMVGNVDTLANCIYWELIKTNRLIGMYTPELPRYKVFREEVKKIIIRYLRKKGIEDSLVQDKNKTKIEEVKNKFMNEIDDYINGIAFFDMEVIEGKPRKNKFICYMFGIDRNKNLRKEVNTIMWDIDRKGLPKSENYTDLYRQRKKMVKINIEKSAYVVNQNGVVIAGEHIFEYGGTMDLHHYESSFSFNQLKYKAEKIFLDKTRYSGERHTEIIETYSVSENPHLMHAEVSCIFDIGRFEFKEKRIKGSFKRTRSKLDQIPFLNDDSITEEAIRIQDRIDDLNLLPHFNLKNRVYDAIFTAFQNRINNMCKTESDKSETELQSLGIVKDK